MSRRLNPRNYDVEELRAAFQANRGENGNGVDEDLLDQQYAHRTDTPNSAIDQDGEWLTASENYQQRSQKPVQNATDGGHPEESRALAERDNPEATDLMHEVDGGRSQAPALQSDGSSDDDLLPLTQLPNSLTAQQEILDWMEGLLSASGQQGTLEVLKYYESIGWLSAECRDQLKTFVEGLRTAGCTDSRPLVIDDHRESLQYISTLARCR